MTAPPGPILITKRAWYCCEVTPAARAAASLNARNRRRAQRNPASPLYRLASSAMASPPLMIGHPSPRRIRHTPGVAQPLQPASQEVTNRINKGVGPLLTGQTYV